MKKYLIILIGLLTTQFAMSQYYFSAQVSSSDPCCISIDAGSWDDNYNDQWWVEIDFNISDYYDNATNGNEFLHCVNNNGIYTVAFFVQGYAGPYWTRDVEVTDCSTIDLECSVANVSGTNMNFNFTPTTIANCPTPYYNIGWRLAGSNDNWNYSGTSVSGNGSGSIFSLSVCTEYEYIIELKCDGSWQGTTFAECTGSFKTRCLVKGGGIKGPISFSDCIGCKTEPENHNTDINTIYEVTVSPNPAKDYLNIESANNTISSLVLLDINGRIILSNEGNNESQLSIDVSSLQTGTYYIKLTDVNGNITTERFVKM